MERASNTWALLLMRCSSPLRTTSRRDATPYSPAPPLLSAQNWTLPVLGSCSLSSGLQRNHSSKLLTSANCSIAWLDFRRVQCHHGVPALFSCFFHAELRSIDQIRHNIFAVEFVLRHRFHNSRAQCDGSRIPRRPQARSRSPQLIGQ